MRGINLLACHHWLGRLFDEERAPTRASRVFHVALATLIFMSVCDVVFESVEVVNQRFGVALWWFEQVATVCFAAEYVLRVWAAVESCDPRLHHPLWGRVRYMRSFFALVDLMSVLPAILGMLGAGDLRTLRLLRLLRMLKLTRHATIFNLLWAVFREEARSIGAVLFILLLTLTISASIMYMIEGEAQPDGFSSIPAAMWWAVETLTTVGYGDLVPVTVPGKIVGGFVTIIGVVAVALFTSLITVSFIDQLHLRREALRKAVEASLADGVITPDERAAIENYGNRLGLPPGAAAATVESMTQAFCPHCGAPIGREPAV